MAFSVTLAGMTFTEANFEGNAYADEATGFPMALQKIVEHVANAWRGTSSTSLALGTGTPRTITITNASGQVPAFAVGAYIRVSRTSDPINTFVSGTITAFNTTTGSCTFTPDISVGSGGPYTDWTIVISGVPPVLSGAPVNADFLVLTLNATLTNERNAVFTSGLKGTDSGANAAYTVVTEHKINAQSGATYTILSSDLSKYVRFTNAGSVAVTVPQATTTFGDGFYFYYITNPAGGDVTFTPTTSTIRGASSFVAKAGTNGLIFSDGTNWQIISSLDLGISGLLSATLTSARSNLGLGSAATQTINALTEFGAVSGVSVSAASTTDIWSGASPFQTVSGNSTINGFGNPASGNPIRILYFSGTPVLTNGANLINLGAADITVRAGDIAIVRYEGSNVTRMLAYSRADGTALISSAVPGRNIVINGNFDIWQRNTTFTAPASGTYTADRWLYGNSSAAVHTVSRSTDVPTVAQAGKLFNYSILLDCTTADAALANGDLVFLAQRIEGYNWAILAQVATTLSFWVKATKTGTYCVALRNSGYDRSYVAEYTISSANTWEKKTINVLASPSAGTWDYTNGLGLELVFTLMCGATFQTTAGAWQSGNFMGTSNQVLGADNTANDFRIAGVQLEAGSTATEFEKVDFNTNLERCQRYYEKTYDYAVFPGAVSSLGERGGLNNAGGAGIISCPLKTRKRTTPTMTFYSPSTGSSGVLYQNGVGDLSASGSGVGEMGCVVTCGSGTASAIILVQYTASAEL